MGEIVQYDPNMNSLVDSVDSLNSYITEKMTGDEDGIFTKKLFSVYKEMDETMMELIEKSTVLEEKVCTLESEKREKKNNERREKQTRFSGSTILASLVELLDLVGKLNVRGRNQLIKDKLQEKIMEIKKNVCIVKNKNPRRKPIKREKNPIKRDTQYTLGWGEKPNFFVVKK